MIGIIQRLINSPEKFSLHEIVQGVQDGTIPAYIGTPLIAQKTQEESRQSAAAQGGAPQRPPIAQQIMQQAEAQEQSQGIPALPTSMPTHLAEGGILHFADGGMYNDDDEGAQAEEDYYKQQQEEGGMSREDQHLFDRLMDQAQASDEEDEEEPQPQVASQPQPKSQGISTLPAVATASYEAAHHAISSKEEGKPRESHAEGVEHITKQKTGSHPYEAMVLEEARRQGVDPRIAMHVLYKETGGAKDPATALSPAGAGGVMQLMPGTAKDLGVADRFDPAQNIRGGVAYLAQLQKQFGEPKLVAAAYNAGPGNVRRYGGVPPFAETQGYVQGLAQGGSVQHFDAGKLVSGDPIGNYFRSMYSDMPSNAAYNKNIQDYNDIFGDTFDPESLANGKLMSQATPLTVPYQGNAGRGYYGGPTAAQLASAAPKTPATNTPSYQNTPQQDFRKSEILAENAAGDQGTTGTTEAAATPESEGYHSPYMKDMLDWINKNKSDLDQSKSEDKYYALLAAGLGMMGGTSPYASANIGQGATQGLGYLMNARKMQMAQENGIQSGLLGLSRADLYDRMHQANIDQHAEAARQRNEYNQGRLDIQQQGVDRQLAAVNANTQAHNASADIGRRKLVFQYDQAFPGSAAEQSILKELNAKKVSDLKPTQMQIYNQKKMNYINTQAGLDMAENATGVPSFDQVMQSKS